jgi:DNA mismatch repair protein MutS
VRAHTAGLHALAATLAEWDLVAALAARAREYGYVRPEMTEGDRIRIVEGRHPVVERMLEAETFVPNDVDLDARLRQVQIITGPNMAGKSTYLRQVGQIVLMAQAGSFVPAREAEIGIADRVFTRVGASDSIARGQSTFLVEMIETSRILHGATSRGLVLLDEIGRGTSTYDGLAIAWAVAERLRRDPLRRPRTLFATHFHELTVLGREEPGYVNLNILVKEWHDRIVFVRRVAEGAADRSYGIQVARLAGLPEDVLVRARAILGGLEQRGARLAGERAAGAPGLKQIQLFVEAEAGRDEAAAELAAALEGLALERLSGLEALRWLEEWQSRLRGRSGAPGRPAQGGPR